MNDSKNPSEIAEGTEESGQGHDLSGQEHDLSGQGYDPSAQGYDPSGQGYDPSAQGYDPYSSDWGMGEEKVKRGNRGVIIAFVLFLIAAGVIGFFWYKDYSDNKKMEKALQDAMSLPDGKFENALLELAGKTRRPDILSQIAFELGVAKDKKAVPKLAEMVSMGGEVGVEAAKALTKIGGEAAKAGLNPIFAEMQKAEGFNKAVYAWSLCMLGDDRGFGPLLEAVVTRLINIKTLPEFDADLIIRMGTTDKLLEMAKSDDAMLKMYSAIELGFREDKDVVPALLGLMKDKNGDVAQASAISLGRINDDRVGPALLATMQEKKDLQDNILLAIAESVGSPGLEAVYKNIQDDPSLKYKVIGKLKKLRDPRSKDLLISILSEQFSGTDEESLTRNKEIRDQALWTLEDLGDPRIAEEMYKKINWIHASETEVPDSGERYRLDDISRKIANGSVVWFSQVQPEGIADYMMKVYDANKPFANTPESAQRVTVDIGPLMVAMGKSGDQRFCNIMKPYLDQDEGFFFAATSFALAELKCPGMIKDFMKRMEMTKAERKEGSFAQLEEQRDWRMEDRLQERRNSIMALKYFRSPEPGEKLMAIALDTTEDQELRREAAASLAYCADEKLMNKILAAISDKGIDVVARASLIQGLWFNPTESAVQAMFGLLEGQGDYELLKMASIVIGEASNPANDERLNKLLDSEDESRQRAALFAIMLSGNTDRLDKVIELLNGEETKLVIKEWYEDHTVFLNKEAFESKRIFKRLAFVDALSKQTEKLDNEISWPWKHLVERLKNGWDGPGGLTPLQIRERLVDAVRNDETYRDMSARILSIVGERGYLLALQSEKGPQSLIARDTLRALNLKSQ